MDNKSLIFQLVDNTYLQPTFQDEIDLAKFTKFPISDIAMLGTAFSPLVKFISSSNMGYTETVRKLGIDTLYAAEDKTGNAMKLTATVRGETDKYIGGYVKNGTTGQTRFKSIPISDLTKNSIVLDPMAMLVAAELMYVEKEIKIIKQQQQDMFKYLLIEKRAKIEGSISFLTKVLNDFKYNFQNQTYRVSMHTKILDIKQEAEQAIIASQKHIELFLNKGKEEYDKLGGELQNYQIALYSYAFSSFVEILVLENIDKSYLEQVSKRIDNFSIKYRETYTNCYNYLESKTEKSPQAFVLEIGANVGKKIGNIIAKTPIGDKTLIDEKILEVAGEIKVFKDNKIRKRLTEFSNYKDTRIKSFQQIINVIDKISNSNQIFFSQKHIYVPSISF